MDPNNNRPINTNPLGQAAAPESVATPISTSFPPQEPTPDPIQTAPVTPAATPPPPTPKKSGGKKIIALLIILLILALGMGGYVFFAKNQLKSAQKISTENSTSIAIPTETIAPTITPASVDQINVESPAADLDGIDTDVLGL